jgi:glycosyltransferase involved in cell wall biosynthesis
MNLLKDKPLVSVVIASYNMAKYLPLAVQSVLNQSYGNFEVIIIDDGSTDDTRVKVDQFLSDERVRYFYQDNKGQAVAKNRGIQESKGDLIAILDADDLWLPEKLAKQIPCFTLSPDIGVVYTNVEFIDGTGASLGVSDRRYYSGKISGQLLIDNFVTLSSVMVRRECFEKVGIFDEQYPMGIDYDLWLRMSAHYAFHYLDDITFQYRIWPGQMSHNYKKRFECAIKIMNSFLEQHPVLLDKPTVDEAWAHTYVSKGNYIVRIEKNKTGAFRQYIKALQFKPAYIPAWKGIVKLLIRR